MNSSNNKEIKSLDISKVFFVVVILVILCGLVLYVLNNRENNDNVADELLVDIAVECEKGEWVEFPVDKKIIKQDGDSLTVYKGVVMDMNQNDDEISSEDNKHKFITHPDYSLVFYSSRRVEIDGWKIKNRGDDSRDIIYVHKIRCAGEESNQRKIAKRQSIMKYVKSHKKEVFELSNYLNDDVAIDEVAFVNEKVFYVTFEQNEGEKTDVILLLELQENEQDDSKLRVLAQYEYDNEGRVLVAGKNNYLEQKTIIYEYDEEINQWSLAW